MIIMHNMPVHYLVPNRVFYKGDGFYLSYNSRDHRIYGSDTTALVETGPDGVGTRFLILCGDHVKAYQDILQSGGSYRECVAYFKDHEEARSSLSDFAEELFPKPLADQCNSVFP